MELLEREEALAALEEAHAAAAAGDGRVLVVIGEPGIGTSSRCGDRQALDAVPLARDERPLGEEAGVVAPCLEVDAVDERRGIRLRRVRCPGQLDAAHQRVTARASV